MNCFYCKGDMTESFTNYTAELEGGRIVVIRNVPCMKCDGCGETVINGEVAIKLEEMIRKCSDIMTEIAVINYSGSAA